MNIVQKRLEDIQPYNNNPRINDKAVRYVKQSIKRFGFRVPIVIDGDGIIVAGHTRYKASIELGLDSVPCVVADDLTPKQIKAYRLADNKTAEHSSWDFGTLKLELDDLKFDFNMSDFGFPLDGEEDAARDEDTSEKPLESVLTVAVEFEDEESANDFYERMLEEGYKCRVLTL